MSDFLNMNQSAIRMIRKFLYMLIYDYIIQDDCSTDNNIVMPYKNRIKIILAIVNIPIKLRNIGI